MLLVLVLDKQQIPPPVLVVDCLWIIQLVSKDTGSLTDQVIAVLKEASRTMPDGVPVDYVAEKLSITKEESQFQLLKLNDEGKAYAGYDDNSYLVI